MKSFLLKQVGKWSKKYANLPDRYIERAMQQVYIILKLQPNKNDTLSAIMLALTDFNICFLQNIIRFIGRHPVASQIIYHAR